MCTTQLSTAQCPLAAEEGGEYLESRAPDTSRDRVPIRPPPTQLHMTSVSKHQIIRPAETPNVAALQTEVMSVVSMSLLATGLADARQLQCESGRRGRVSTCAPSSTARVPTGTPVW
jgi:hypothetical protein